MEEKIMLRALEVSKKALPHCKPNPPVGCVLVRGRRIVSEGYTQPIGGNHAEVEAIKAFKGDLEGLTAYVTREPCSFAGRTPACAKLLASKGIKKVVVAMLDPDARNNGAGIQLLRDSGIDVHIGLCQEEVRQFLTPYLGKS